MTAVNVCRHFDVGVLPLLNPCRLLHLDNRDRCAMPPSAPFRSSKLGRNPHKTHHKLIYFPSNHSLALRHLLCQAGLDNLPRQQVNPGKNVIAAVTMQRAGVLQTAAV